LERVNQLNKRGFGGFADWGLPHREELRTIADYNGQIPAVNPKYFLKPNEPLHLFKGFRILFYREGIFEFSRFRGKYLVRKGSP
jgi:hypothetical protein